MTITKLTHLAQVTINKDSAGLGSLPDALTPDNVGDALALAFGLAGGIALVVIAYGGLKFVLSQGNPQEVTKAKNTITDGLLGLAIIIASAGIVGFVVEALT
jgi:hypothetical protein